MPASSNADEDDGFVLTYVYDATRDASDLVILDASSFAATPLATIRLPQRVRVRRMFDCARRNADYALLCL